MTTVVLHIKTTCEEYLITASSLYSLCKCWVPVKITCIIPSHKEDYFYWFVLKNILLKLTSDSYYSSYYFCCLRLSLPPSPSPGLSQSQILNWNAPLPHKLSRTLNECKIGSLGRKEGEGGGYPLLISGTTERDRGRMLSYEPCDH